MSLSGERGGQRGGQTVSCPRAGLLEQDQTPCWALASSVSSHPIGSQALVVSPRTSRALACVWPESLFSCRLALGQAFCCSDPSQHHSAECPIFVSSQDLMAKQQLVHSSASWKCLPGSPSGTVASTRKPLAPARQGRRLLHVSSYRAPLSLHPPVLGFPCSPVSPRDREPLEGCRV